MRNKYISNAQLEKIKKEKKSIVLCHGVFDLFHIGHLTHLHEAKKFGDVLIVSITSDKFVNKGPGRPYFNQEHRLNVLSSISIIDYVILSDAPHGLNVINKIKPNIYFKGPDYSNHKKDFTNYIKIEERAVKKNKGKIFYGQTKTFSSSTVLNKISNFSKDQKKIINEIKKEISLDSILDKINSFKNKLKVLVIGEMIIDRFIFCTALGKSGKEAILNLEKNKEEQIVGGIGAIGNHMSSFSRKIKLLTYIGNKEDKKKFIIKNLKKNINLDFIIKNDSPTITKSKIIDLSNNSKLLMTKNCRQKRKTCFTVK